MRTGWRESDTVSISWLPMVEKLLRNQRCLPFVSRFQKWNACTSTDWATRYAIIDAITFGFMKA